MNTILRSSSFLLVSILTCFQLSASAARAEGDGNAVSGIREYDEVHSDSFETARSLMMKANANLRSGRTNRAIKQLEKALTLDKDDPDVHTLYAQVLETKIGNQSDRDPEVYRKCVSEWLIVLRQEVGEEKGLTFKGVGIGNGLFNDDFRSIMAKKHLLKIVGFLPKPWETDTKYLKRALVPASTSVTATIKPSSQTNEQAAKPSVGKDSE